MNLQEFTTTTCTSDDWKVRPRIVCKDGFSMSVQGHPGSYSDPRRNTDTYIKMEIGFPSVIEELILPFAESPEKPTDTVYAYVDCNIIQEVIDKHGGIDEEKTFNTSAA